MKNWIYSTWYRRFPVPWDIGPRAELIELVQTGRIKPSRAIDLGCGTGSNAIYLAQHGFEVTGVDFADGAIEKAIAKRNAAGVDAEFVVGDLTNLHGISGHSRSRSTTESSMISPTKSGRSTSTRCSG